MKKNKRPFVSIVMGSQSDYATMKYGEDILKALKIKYEVKIVSAHRTPKRMYNYAKNAEKINGRWAMVGLVAGFISYATTGNFFFGGILGF